MTQAAHTSPTIGFISLGCPKALVDSERILTQLRAEGYTFSDSYEGTDLVIVNTCGFLDSAREESLGAIGEAMNQNGKVIVTGCLGAEPEVIEKQYPNVLAITGPQQYETVLEAVHRAAPRPHDPYSDLLPAGGVKLTPRHYAYLKISEGCNNRCSFCIIPSMRGDLVSRPIDDVLREAEALVSAGVKELLIISQDTSAYGVDVKYAPRPWQDTIYQTRYIDLCRALGEMGVWVRMHYVYPYPHVDASIQLMAEGKILPYLDIPFQHASPRVLKAMKRPAHQEKTRDRIQAWRKICPELTIRSTFIVGFPGETEEDFEMLLDWLENVQLDRVGCFKYEPVVGATANILEGAVPEAVKEERWHRFMQTQQKISATRLQQKIGKTLPVIIDGPVIIDREEGEGYLGRSMGDAPEIDGVVYVASHELLRAGDIVQVKITDADAYDLHGVTSR